MNEAADDGSGLLVIKKGTTKAIPIEELVAQAAAERSQQAKAAREAKGEGGGQESTQDEEQRREP